MAKDDQTKAASLSLSDASAGSAETWQHKIADFVDAILHGDGVHQGWLREAGEAFILGKPMPAPRDAKTGRCLCVYCGHGAQDLEPPHYLKRVNRLGDLPAIWICTKHQYFSGEVRRDLFPPNGGSERSQEAEKI